MSRSQQGGQDPVYTKLVLQVLASWPQLTPSLWGHRAPQMAVAGQGQGSGSGGSAQALTPAVPFRTSGSINSRPVLGLCVGGFQPSPSPRPSPSALPVPWCVCGGDRGTDREAPQVPGGVGRWNHGVRRNPGGSSMCRLPPDSPQTPQERDRPRVFIGVTR